MGHKLNKNKEINLLNLTTAATLPTYYNNIKLHVRCMNCIKSKEGEQILIMARSQGQLLLLHGMFHQII